MNYLELNRLLYEHQYGFQPFLASTFHSLTQLIYYIYSALNDKKYGVGDSFLIYGKRLLFAHIWYFLENYPNMEYQEKPGLVR
jgi:hypothetical protein